MATNNPLNYQNVLKPETIRAISSLPTRAHQIADRWASRPQWKAKMLAHEQDGTLLDRLKEQADLETEALVGADSESMAHLADHEKMELLGPPPGP